MSAETHFAVYVLLAMVGLFSLGLALGFVALRWQALERLAFNSMALIRDMPSPFGLGMMLIFPPLLTMVGAWYVLVAAGRTDPSEERQ